MKFLTCTHPFIPLTRLFNRCFGFSRRALIVDVGSYIFQVLEMSRVFATHYSGVVRMQNGLVEWRLKRNKSWRVFFSFGFALLKFVVLWYLMREKVLIQRALLTKMHGQASHLIEGTRSRDLEHRSDAFSFGKIQNHTVEIVSVFLRSSVLAVNPMRTHTNQTIQVMMSLWSAECICNVLKLQNKRLRRPFSNTNEMNTCSSC